MTELKISQTSVETHHGNTRIECGDTVHASGGMGVPTGKCVVIDIEEDKYSGGTMVLLAQKRDGGDVKKVEASTIDKYRSSR